MRWLEKWRFVLWNSVYAVVLAVASTNPTVPRWAHALLGLSLCIMGASIYREIEAVISADLEAVRRALEEERKDYIATMEQYIVSVEREARQWRASK